MTFYSRADWGSSVSPGGNVIGVVSEAYIHHFNSNIEAPRTVDSCKSRMRGAQAYHVSLGWGDIGYSFCVSDAGDVYEGRGWNRSGAHTYGFNSRGYGVCWLGDSNVSRPSDSALRAIADLIKTGISLGKITPNPTIVAHRDRVPDTSCCGDVMYSQLPQIRALVAGTGPTPAPAPTQPEDLYEEEEMLVSMVDPNGTVIIVNGHQYTEMPGPWDKAEQGMRQMIAAGILKGNPDGSPRLTQLNAQGFATLRKV